MKRSFHKGSIPHSDDRNPVPAYFARCRCGVTDFIATNSSTSSIPEERLMRKFRQRGWTITKRHEYCPECTRKGIQLQPKEQETSTMSTKTVVPLNTEPRIMKPEDRRRIFRAIDERWDEPGRRYSGITTDKSLSEELHCPQAWVREVREQSFGTFGTNEELDAVQEQLAGLEKEIKKQLEVSLDCSVSLETLEQQLTALRKRVEKVTGV